ncbi:hypothetical protein EST38_g12747 [Candolleomyces aberdarensis]|uniref:BTB domain-containing protein n=1 Tax=Candolleomyces aberdarensis TaxID=2316362 RepID=A0A4Q2D1M1_9AGAR|nr:hypothetical protein EST38_g12747 [Candolleomyces aberdarensis]
MASETTESTGPATRGKFYTEDTQFIVFQVENVLHRVPRFALVKHSEMFSDMFQLPQPGQLDGGSGSGVSSSAEGSSDENPIRIPECFTNLEFESLLEFIYPTEKSNTLNKEQLFAALRLAFHWEMHNVISNIMDYTKKLDLTPKEKLLLGKRYKIQQYLEEGFFHFIDPVEYKPTLEDAEELGWDTIGQILLMRERLRKEITVASFGLSSLRCSRNMVDTVWTEDDTRIEKVSSDDKKRLIEEELGRLLKQLLGTNYSSP